jgi:hypothetical protein
MDSYLNASGLVLREHVLALVVVELLPRHRLVGHAAREPEGEDDGIEALNVLDIRRTLAEPLVLVDDEVTRAAATRRERGAVGHRGGLDLDAGERRKSERRESSELRGEHDGGWYENGARGRKKEKLVRRGRRAERRRSEGR